MDSISLRKDIPPGTGGAGAVGAVGAVGAAELGNGGTEDGG